MTICEYLYEKIKRIQQYIYDFFEDNDYKPLKTTPSYHNTDNYNIL